MECLVPAKPEKITQNSSINLEKMSVFFWDAERDMGRDESFDPIRRA
jgi:hypothetical protein